MSDTASRAASGASQFIADALLRSVSGASALFRIPQVNSDSSQAEIGLAATTYGDVTISPVVMRKLRPDWQNGESPRWELLASATSIEQQISALDIASAQSLFAMALQVDVAGQSYLIESATSNEAFGKVYLYRMLLREMNEQAV